MHPASNDHLPHAIGSDCVGQFQAMQECLVSNTDYYGLGGDEPPAEAAPDAASGADPAVTAVRDADAELEAQEQSADQS